MTALTLKLKTVEKDGRGVYVLEHRAGTVYLTRATTDGKMPEAITLQAPGLVEDKPVPEADKKAQQIARLKAQLAALEAAPVPSTPAPAEERLSEKIARETEPARKATKGQGRPAA